MGNKPAEETAKQKESLIAIICAKAAQEKAAGSDAVQKQTTQSVPGDAKPEPKSPTEDCLEKKLEAAARKIRSLEKTNQSLTKENDDLKAENERLKKENDVLSAQNKELHRSKADQQESPHIRIKKRLVQARTCSGKEKNNTLGEYAHRKNR